MMNKNEVRITRKILIVEIFRLMIVIIVRACAFKIKKVIRKDILCYFNISLYCLYTFRLSASIVSLTSTVS